MNLGWDYVANSAAFEFFSAQRPSDRRRLKASFENLVRNPAIPAVAYTHDEIGRKVSII